MVVATVVSFHRLSEWAYWLPVVALLALALVPRGRGAPSAWVGTRTGTRRRPCTGHTERWGTPPEPARTVGTTGRGI